MHVISRRSVACGAVLYSDLGVRVLFNEVCALGRGVWVLDGVILDYAEEGNWCYAGVME